MGRASSAVPPATTSRGGAATRISSSVVSGLPRDPGDVGSIRSGFRKDVATGTVIGTDLDITFEDRVYRVPTYAFRTFLNTRAESLGRAEDRDETLAWTRACTKCSANQSICPFETHRQCPKYKEELALLR